MQDRGRPGPEGPDPAELAYEAATGLGSWHAVGLALKRMVGANTATLWTGDPAAGRVEMLYAENIPAEAERAYALRYFDQDPYIASYNAMAARGGPRGAVLGEAFLDYEAYRRGEFYNDFGAGIGLFHILGTTPVLPDGDILPIGLHRPERAAPFDEADRRALDAALPHLIRAVRLGKRLRESGLRQREALAAAILQALPLAAMVADAQLRVLFANPAAEALARDRAGIRLLAAGPAAAPVVLGTERRGEAEALSRLVRSVALGLAPGGGLRLHGAEVPGEPPPAVALLVTALPPALAASLGGGAPGGMATGRVLVVARHLGLARRPDPAILADLFGLSPAEASVAAALAGGLGAEAVAAARGVGQATVRGQVRTILEKTGAANLRDLERLLGILSGP